MGVGCFCLDPVLGVGSKENQSGPKGTMQRITGAFWVWLKIKQEGLRRLWSMFPLTRVPFWYRFFEPQLFG